MKVTACPKGYEEPEFNFDSDWEADEADHAARLKQHLIEMGHTGEYTGEIISFGVADGSAQYMIVDGAGRYGKRSFLIHLAYGDGYQYNGVEHFPKAEIVQMAKRARALAKLTASRTEWWDTRAVGETVHYHDGFGRFVRGNIVETPEGKAMQPTALVGDWPDYERPSRRVDGTIHLPHHARKIVEGETMKPHSSNMFENPEFNDRGVDPTKLEAIDITVPEMDNEAAEIANLIAAANSAITLLNAGGTCTDMKRNFRKASKIIAEAV